MTEPRQFWKPVPLSQLQAASEGIDWVWEGILARRRITLLSAQAKAGKSTLLSLLLREMGRGGHLLGCKVGQGTAVVVTEETADDWIIRREHLGITDHAEAICIPFITKPSPTDWLDLLRQGYLDVKARKPELIVFDTLSHLWPVQEENSNSEQQVALMPLRGMSELGPAVLLFHHSGAAGERSRGATELEGFVDQIAHLEWENKSDPSNRQRRLTVKGRLTSSPERLQVSLNEAGDDYQVVQGNLRPIRSGIWQTLAQLLPTEAPGISIRELQGSWPDDEDLPSEDTIWKTLTRCASKAGARQTNDKPARWWMAN